MAVEHSQELSQVEKIKHYLAAKLGTVVPKDFLELQRLDGIYELLRHHGINLERPTQCTPAIESVVDCTEQLNNLAIDDGNGYQALIKGLRDMKLDKPADVLEKRGVVVKAEVTYKNSADTRTHEKLLVKLNILSQCRLPFDDKIEKYSKQLKEIDVFILDAMPINECYSKVILWLWCRSTYGLRSLEVIHASSGLNRILTGLFKHLQNSVSMLKRIQPKSISIDCKEYEHRILNDPVDKIDIRNAEDILVCSICLEIFEDPRTLPCLHTFCHDCLTRYCKACLSTDSLMCPICRKVHPLQSDSQFPRNFQIERLKFRLGLMNTVLLSSSDSGIDNVLSKSENSVSSIRISVTNDTIFSSAKSVTSVSSNSTSNSSLSVSNGVTPGTVSSASKDSTLSIPDSYSTLASNTASQSHTCSGAYLDSIMIDGIRGRYFYPSPQRPILYGTVPRELFGMIGGQLPFLHDNLHFVGHQQFSHVHHGGLLLQGQQQQLLAGQQFSEQQGQHPMLAGTLRQQQQWPAGQQFLEQQGQHPMLAGTFGQQQQWPAGQQFLEQQGQHKLLAGPWGQQQQTETFQYLASQQTALICNEFTRRLLSGVCQTWLGVLEAEFSKPYFKELCDSFANETIDKVYPPDLVFAWTKLTPIQNIKVVIIGQDPYFNSGQANGLCFSVPKGVPIPRSLAVIYNELEADIPGFKSPSLGDPINGYSVHGDLTGWAQQGVLLLNGVLTVQDGTPNSHKRQGWETFTDAVVYWVASNNTCAVFMLWGKYAQKKGARITNHHVLWAPHPMSRRGGFLGCKHFSICNQLLEQQGLQKIDWTYLP